MTAWLRAAVDEGLLPATATLPSHDNRPWPVVLLTALGAWLAALPLIGVVGLLLGDLISRSAEPYVIGPLVLAGAIVVLRSRTVPLFVEQLAVPALIVGGGALAFGMFRDLATSAAAALLALVAVGIALALPRPWLRVLLGAAAAVLAVVACLPARWDGFRPELHAGTGLAWHAGFALWAATMAAQRWMLRDGAGARAAAALEPVAAGWLLATLAGLAWWSGMTFLAGASLGGMAGGIVREVGTAAGRGTSHALQALQVLSVLLAAAATGWLGRAWPALRQPWCAAVAVVVILLAAFLPALGATLLALAWCGASHRWRLAGTAALAAAWIVGSFYYQAAWPLATKAIVLVAAGALLAAIAWWASPRAARADACAALPAGRSAWGIGIAAIAVLAVANVGIWQKERLIAAGQPVFVELAPVDPRSIMQGDYMALNFLVPSDGRFDGLLAAERPRVVARRDPRGVATLLRRDAGTPLAGDELVIELTPKNGRWTVVTDAWFFREGEAQRWAKARYGEFRVDAGGRALLVGLRGPKLEAL